MRSVEFLCNIISIEGVEVHPRKTEAVKNLPRPLAPTDIRRFIGLVIYYIRYVDGFASVASPLETLTQKNIKF